MISTEQIQSVMGGTVVDESGAKIGTSGQVYVDDATGQPEWVTVNTGLFGTTESFVPLASATLDKDVLRVPYAKDKVKDAPRVGDDGHLSEDEEDALYRYYDLSTAGSAADSAGYDTSGPTTDEAMTRSEERLNVGTENVQAGRARLRKHIVTEQQAITVPVTHEEVRIERQPITDANRDAAMAGGDLTSEEHEVVLTEERAVVNKETVPVERVRLAKDTVSEQQQVTETVRKEQIETDLSDVPANAGLKTDKPRH